jgi:hypothetical protein
VNNVYLFNQLTSPSSEEDNHPGISEELQWTEGLSIREQDAEGAFTDEKSVSYLTLVVIKAVTVLGMNPPTKQTGKQPAGLTPSHTTEG